jgi:hypothetical protein
MASFVHLVYRMISPYLVHHHSSYVLGCWNGWLWLVYRCCGHFQDNGLYYFQANIIVDGERLVLPTSKDVSTWLEHGYDTLVHEGSSCFLSRLLGNRR